jgi:hypothetical protein
VPLLLFDIDSQLGVGNPFRRCCMENELLWRSPIWFLCRDDKPWKESAQEILELGASMLIWEFPMITAAAAAAAAVIWELLLLASDPWQEEENAGAHDEAADNPTQQESAAMATAFKASW